MTVRRKRSILSGMATVLGYLRREGGNMAAIMALLLVPMVGAMSMGVEASSWFFISRSAQNAADSAAIAAANNGAEAVAEGRANARAYGFTNGSDNVAVAISSGQTCPDGTAACYKATVTKQVPIYLTRIVGYNGDSTVAGQRFKTIVSTALAEPISAISFPSCITALGSDTNAPGNNNTAIGGSGTPNAAGPGCSISAVGPSPSSIACTGNNGLGAAFGFATGTIAGSGGHACVGTSTTQSSFVFCDPYSASPAAGCAASSYATAVANAVSSAPACTAAPSSWSATMPTSVCYNTNFTVPSNASGVTAGSVIVMTNGANLDVNSKSLSNVTVIFTKGTAANPGSLTGGSSSVSISAPSSGNLSGIAAYQVAPNTCTSSVCDNWSVNGSRTIDITGLVYLPFTNASFGGSVTLSSTGRCFVSVTNSFATNGTGYVLDRSGCTNDGLSGLPTVLRFRAALVK